MNIFTESGDEIKVGDKVRLVHRSTRVPFTEGLWSGAFLTVRSVTKFLTFEELGQWAVFTKNRTLLTWERIWEIQSKTLAYRVDQEPQEDEETL